MDVQLRRKWILGAALCVILLVAYAWIGGGRQRVHEISYDLPLPGESK